MRDRLVIINEDKRPLSRKFAEFWLETLIFFKIRLKAFGSNAIAVGLFSMVIPAGVLVMMALMPINITREVAIIYISGNIITSISNLCITTLAQLLIGIRMKNGFEHLATLPISDYSPLLGTIMSAAVSTLPALIIMPIVGMLLFDIRITINFWLVLVVLICIVIMSGIGSVIGTFSENYQTSNTLAMVAMFFVMFATPVYYSMDSLPQVVQVFQRMLPFSYALEAMRALMTDGKLTQIVIIDILVLIFFMILSLLFMKKFFTWKKRR